MHTRVWFGKWNWSLELHMAWTGGFRHAYYKQNFDSTSISIGLHFISLWLTCHQWNANRKDRKIGLSHFGGTFHWKLWTPDHEWSANTPKWRDGWFNPADFLLGEQDYAEETSTTESVIVTMPEKGYSATVRLFTSTWTRSRFPFIKKSVERAEVELFDGGIPIPGKGESSWDCGDNALLSHTCPAASIQEAIQSCIESVASTRERYGGRNWKPSNTN